MRHNYHVTPVLEFHEAFGHPVAWSPTVATAELRVLRAKLLLEEALEFVEAAGLEVTGNPANPNLTVRQDAQPDLVKMADALADVRVIADGSNIVFGLPGNKIFLLAHEANMSKLGADGKPIYRSDGKILKGPNFRPPEEDIRNLLNLYSERAE